VIKQALDGQEPLLLLLLGHADVAGVLDQALVEFVLCRTEVRLIVALLPSDPLEDEIHFCGNSKVGVLLFIVLSISLRID